MLHLQILTPHQSIDSLLPQLLSDIVASAFPSYILTFIFIFYLFSPLFCMLGIWVASRLVGLSVKLILLFSSGADPSRPSKSPRIPFTISVCPQTTVFWDANHQHLWSSLASWPWLLEPLCQQRAGGSWKYVSPRVDHSQWSLGVSVWKPDALSQVGTALKNTWHSWSLHGARPRPPPSGHCLYQVFSSLSGSPHCLHGFSWKYFLNDLPVQQSLYQGLLLGALPKKALLLILFIFIELKFT